MERPAVGQAELAALVGVVARLAQVVLDVLERQRLVVALDREDLAEDAFEARVGPLARPGRRPGGTARSCGSGSRSGRGPGTRRRSGRNSVAWPGMIRRTVVAVGMSSRSSRGEEGAGRYGGRPSADRTGAEARRSPRRTSRRRRPRGCRRAPRYPGTDGQVAPVPGRSSDSHAAARPPRPRLAGGRRPGPEVDVAADRQ